VEGVVQRENRGSEKKGKQERMNRAVKFVLNLKKEHGEKIHGGLIGRVQRK
jgi:hypothetical protein